MKKFLIIILIFLIGCTNLYDKNNPDIKEATNKCKSLNINGEDNSIGPGYSCYLNYSLEKSNPSICYLVSASLDDACIQNYYEIKNDIKSCEQIKTGMKTNCLYYFNNNHSYEGFSKASGNA